MKLTVKTLKGTHFEIQVQPSSTIMAVKKNIEELQGKGNYPWGQQLLIHNGKVLKDETTLEENKVGEDGFLVVMLSKNKSSSTGGSSSQSSASVTAAAPTKTHPGAPVSSNTDMIPETRTTDALSDAYGQAASNLVAGSNQDQIVDQLMDMGGGSWDRDMVLRALRAAYNNPERAVDYLYSGIPASAEIAVPVASNITEAPITESSPLSGLPNSAPLNMFPQGAPGSGAGAGAGTLVGSLGFLRNNPQFRTLRAMVQANPQILQPMLQELSKQNPQLLRLIQDNHAEFLRLINDPVEEAEGVDALGAQMLGTEGELYDQPDMEMPHTVNVTPEEQLAIERLEAMGFDRARVVEAFLACDRNEELAANYLLEHTGDED